MSRVFSPSMMGSDLVRRQRVFTKDDFVKTRFLFRILFLVAFMAILSLFYIWTRVQIVEYGYELNMLKSRQHQLAEENKKLRLEAATLKSPQRLEQMAINELKMAPLRPEQIQTLP